MPRNDYEDIYPSSESDYDSEDHDDGSDDEHNPNHDKAPSQPPSSDSHPDSDSDSDLESDVNDDDDEQDVSASSPVPLSMFEFKQNDPKADTGMKLVKFGCARAMPPNSKFRGMILSAENNVVCSKEDVERLFGNLKSEISQASGGPGGPDNHNDSNDSKSEEISNHQQDIKDSDLRILSSETNRNIKKFPIFGLAGINCSWNRLDECKIPKLGNIQNHRTLPFLLAANPVNYGKAMKLSTAEAIAATLFLTGFEKQARAVLIKYFKWGRHFFELNKTVLYGYYKGCRNGMEIRAKEKEFLDMCNAERGLRRMGLKEKSDRNDYDESEEEEDIENQNQNTVQVQLGRGGNKGKLKERGNRIPKREKNLTSNCNTNRLNGKMDHSNY